MPTFSRIALIALVGLMALGMASAASSKSRTLSGRSKAEIIEQQAMIFFVAQGAANSCGPGCNKWIAAVGTFDAKVIDHLREFLSEPGRKNLPIFFHSPGGLIGASGKVGNLMREKRMTAGIGRTIPEGCKDFLIPDTACRRIMAVPGEKKARLHFDHAICNSACAYAFFGAAVRNIASGARMGIHASFRVEPTKNRSDARQRRVRTSKKADEKPSYDVLYSSLRRYAVRMGVDSKIVDLARETDTNSMRFLSRQELKSFGVVADGVFETPWRLLETDKNKPTPVKSITRLSPTGNRARLTTLVAFTCLGRGMTLTVIRELPSDEVPNLRVVSGTDLLLNFHKKTIAYNRIHVQTTIVPVEMVYRAASAISIVLMEQTNAGSSETKLSTNGLLEALKKAPGGCGHKA